MINISAIDSPIFGYLLLGLIIIFGPSIAERFRLPGLLGLLIGGALVGPNMLSILDDFTAFENIGQLGILYLIFPAGLQMDLEIFRRFLVHFGKLWTDHFEPSICPGYLHYTSAGI
jgi:Kef-type K+ transport system membrane component KefB